MTKSGRIMKESGGNLLITAGMVVVGLILAIILFKVTLWFVIPLLAWAAAGWGAGQITNQEFGLGESIQMGIAGGLVSFVVFRILDVGILINSGLIGDIISGVIGALMIIGARNLLSKRQGAT